MTPPELKKAVQDILPQLIAEDPLVRDFVLRTVSNYYDSREETESKFDRVLAELQRDREEQSRKWDEQSRQWDEQSQQNQNTLATLERDREEQSRKWDEQYQQNRETLATLERDREEQSRKWDEQYQQNQNTFATLERDREEQSRKWDEQYQQNQNTFATLERDREEQSRKWDEQSRKWDEQYQQNQNTLATLERDREEQSRHWDEQHQQTQTMLAEIQDQKRRYESTIGAIGSRWGLYSEESFRSALKGILEQSFGVQVLNVNDFDEAGEVFGRPDQVELDIVITNGSVIACEIKSSLSKSDMYSFDRKVAFYQKRHERPVSRKLVISPMVDQRALPVAEALGIEVYSSPQSLPGYQYGSRDNVL
jgi:hypothetical protein